MGSPLFSIVIPVLGNWPLTRDCLMSLRDHTPAGAFEVIVADNGSSDETARELVPLGEGLFPGRFVRLRFERNRNFGPACNAGASAATAPLVLFLNNDTLATPGWSGPLLAAMRGDGSPGATGPLLLYPDDTVQHLGVTVTPLGVDHLYKGIPAAHPLVGRPRRLRCLTGAALLVPRPLFMDIGGFHEGYRNGCEDLELTARIRERGLELACVTTSRVYHLESKTPGRMDKEKDNFRLLFERCGDLLPVDIHIHAANDGFEVRVNAWDDLDMIMTPWASEQLFASIPPDNPEILAALLGRNPFWVQGAERLCALYEKAAAAGMAFAAAWKALEIHPTVTGCKKALGLAGKSGAAENIAACERLLGSMLSRRADRPARLERILQRARLHNDGVLERLYADSFHGPAAVPPPL